MLTSTSKAKTRIEAPGIARCVAWALRSFDGVFGLDSGTTPFSELIGVGPPHFSQYRYV